MPGNLVLPTPNAYRSPFRHPDGSHDWRTELEYGFSMVDQQSSGSLAACLVEPILSSGGIGMQPMGNAIGAEDHVVEAGLVVICVELVEETQHDSLNAGSDDRGSSM